MKADALLSRLEKVKRTGNGTWLACCPSHADKTPSLTVRELEDERVLVHCFAGCDVEQVLGAVGLDFDALFPDKPIDHAKPLRRPFPAADVLEALSLESRIVALSAAQVARGESLSESELDRLRVANLRIQQGRDLALG